jgi:hypothetical protein
VRSSGCNFIFSSTNYTASPVLGIMQGQSRAGCGGRKQSWCLAREDVARCRIGVSELALLWLPTHDGPFSQSQRASVISFATQPHFTVFLLSLSFHNIISIIPLMYCVFVAHGRCDFPCQQHPQTDTFQSIAYWKCPTDLEVMTGWRLHPIPPSFQSSRWVCSAFSW